MNLPRNYYILLTVILVYEFVSISAQDTKVKRLGLRPKINQKSVHFSLINDNPFIVYIYYIKNNQRLLRLELEPGEVLDDVSVAGNRFEIQSESNDFEAEFTLDEDIKNDDEVTVTSLVDKGGKIKWTYFDALSNANIANERATLRNIKCSVTSNIIYRDIYNIRLNRFRYSKPSTTKNLSFKPINKPRPDHRYQRIYQSVYKPTTQYQYGKKPSYHGAYKPTSKYVSRPPKPYNNHYRNAIKATVLSNNQGLKFGKSGSQQNGAYVSKAPKPSIKARVRENNQELKIGKIGSQQNSANKPTSNYGSRPLKPSIKAKVLENNQELRIGKSGSQPNDDSKITNNTDISEITSNSDISEIINDSNISDIITDSDIPDIVNNSDVSEITNISNISDITNNSDVSGIIDNSNIPKVTSNSNIPDIINDSNIPDISEIIDNSDISEVNSNSDIPDIINDSDISEVTNNSSMSDIINDSDISELKSNSDTSDIITDSDIPVIVNNSDISEVTNNSDISVLTKRSVPSYRKYKQFYQSPYGARSTKHGYGKYQGYQGYRGYSKYGGYGKYGGYAGYARYNGHGKYGGYSGYTFDFLSEEDSTGFLQNVKQIQKECANVNFAIDSNYRIDDKLIEFLNESAFPLASYIDETLSFVMRYRLNSFVVRFGDMPEINKKTADKIIEFVKNLRSGLNNHNVRLIGLFESSINNYKSIMPEVFQYLHEVHLQITDRNPSFSPSILGSHVLITENEKIKAAIVSTNSTETSANRNVLNIVKHFLSLGVAPRKISVELSTQGFAYKHNLGADAVDIGSKALGLGSYANKEFELTARNPLVEKHIYDQNTVCQIRKKKINGWTTVSDTNTTFSYNDQNYLTYHTKESVQQLVDVVATNKLGGLFVDAINADNIFGTSEECGEAYTITNLGKNLLEDSYMKENDDSLEI